MTTYSPPQTKADVIERLADVQRGLIDTVSAMSNDQFYKGSAESWSAADYLKHLLLSIKPLVKAIRLPKDQLQGMFGLATGGSRSYEAFVELYTSMLSKGLRAEDYNAVVPATYRLPQSDKDEKTLLTESWDDANTRLIDALAAWDESDLDVFQLPHPGVGMITLREMLYFTLYHNTMHWGDIQRAGK